MACLLPAFFLLGRMKWRRARRRRRTECKLLVYCGRASGVRRRASNSFATSLPRIHADARGSRGTLFRGARGNWGMSRLSPHWPPHWPTFGTSVIASELRSLSARMNLESRSAVPRLRKPRSRGQPLLCGISKRRDWPTPSPFFCPRIFWRNSSKCPTSRAESAREMGHPAFAARQTVEELNTIVIFS